MQCYSRIFLTQEVGCIDQILPTKKTLTIEIEYFKAQILFLADGLSKI